MSSIEEFSRDALARQRTAGRERTRRTIERWHGAQPVAQVDGRARVVFCSNDYLGLARDPRVADALASAARCEGVGSGASHLVCGHSREHHLLEEELARFTGRERALLFSSGYLANLGVITALAGRDDHIVEDRLDHASLIDAALLSRASLERYAHADVAGARQRLASAVGGRKLLVTDGVFSMDGDLAPLAALAQVARQHDAWLMVDDAHGLGVLGPQGRGSLELAGLDASAAPILMGTLGKAFGTFGAFVAGSADLIDLLLQTSRPYIYTTGLPPALAAATRASLALAAAAHERRERLRAHIALFRSEVASLGLQLMDSQTPIQPIVLGTNEQALAADRILWERGVWVSAIRPPTVPEGAARLRVTLSAGHTHEQILQLLESLAEVARRLSR